MPCLQAILLVLLINVLRFIQAIDAELPLIQKWK